MKYCNYEDRESPNSGSVKIEDLNSSKSSGLDGFGSPGLEFEIESFERLGKKLQNMNVNSNTNMNSNQNMNFKNNRNVNSLCVPKVRRGCHKVLINDLNLSDE